MTRLALFFITAILVAGVLPVSGQQKNWSAGILVGSPSGLSIKNYLQKGEAVHGGIAMIQKEKPETHLFAGIEIHSSDWIELKGNPLTAFYGVGVKVFTGADNGLGIRGSTGLEYHMPGFPLSVYLDLAPVFFLVPATSFTLDTGIGVHYRF